MSLEGFLRKVVELLDEAEIPYMVTGSLAAAYHAVPRATQDIDVVIAAEERDVGRLVDGLLAAGWYADRDAAAEACRSKGQFNAVEPDSGWKADFILRKDRPYSLEEFRRRDRVSLLGTEVTIASVEDVLIAKLEWSRLGDSALQRRDVTQLLKRAWARLDQAYVGRWVVELGLTSEWDDALAAAGVTSEPEGVE